MYVMTSTSRVGDFKIVLLQITNQITTVHTDSVTGRCALQYPCKHDWQRF